MKNTDNLGSRVRLTERKKTGRNDVHKSNTVVLRTSLTNGIVR